MLRSISAVLMSFIGLASAQATIKGEEVEYKAENTVHKGYLVYDDAVTGKRPGVLVVHEWWGHDQHARDSAHRLAEAGYVALAVDMYGDGKQAAHPDDAGKLSGDVKKDLPLMKRRFEAGMKLLKNQARVDSKRFAAIGYSFGGGVALDMARVGENLRGVASFYGDLKTVQPARPGGVKARVLVMNGAEDPFVPADQIAAFKKEMESAKVDYKFVNYPGAKHSFANLDADSKGAKFNLPLAYNATADQESWAELQSFLKDIFK